jgi:hypothetical protein
MVVTKTTRMPIKNKTSAIFSHLPPSLILPLMERKESTQLSINEMIATITISSITVLCAAFRYLKRSIPQNTSLKDWTMRLKYGATSRFAVHS